MALRPFGRFLLEELAGYGIETNGVILDPVRRTTVAFVGLDRAGVPDYLFYWAASSFFKTFARGVGNLCLYLRRTQDFDKS